MAAKLQSGTEHVICGLAFDQENEIHYSATGESVEEVIGGLQQSIGESDPDDTTLFRLVAFDMQHPEVHQEIFDVLGRGKRFVEPGSEYDN